MSAESVAKQAVAQIWDRRNQHERMEENDSAHHRDYQSIGS